MSLIIIKLIRNKLKTMNNVYFLYNGYISIKEVGSKSKTLIPIIILIEKEIANEINLFIYSFLIFRKITRPPITVEKPAKKEINIAYIPYHLIEFPNSSTIL